MHVFLAFDRRDAASVGEVTAAVAAEINAVDSDLARDLRFEMWAPESEAGATVSPSSARPRFYDTDGRVLVDDANAIATAAGMLAVVSDRAADSVLVRAQLEIAYGHRVPVAGVQVDAAARPPRNLSSSSVLAPDPVPIAELLATCSQHQQQQAALPWHQRLRLALTADRDTRS